MQFSCINCVFFFVIRCRYVLEKVDLVIVGAEGVVESGGIINKVRFSRKHVSALLAAAGLQTHSCVLQHEEMFLTFYLLA